MAPERCVGTSLESLFDQSHGMWIFSRAVTFAQTNVNKPVSFTLSMRLERPEKVFCVVVLDGTSSLNQRQMRIYLLRVQNNFSGFLAPEVHNGIDIYFPENNGSAKDGEAKSTEEGDHGRIVDRERTAVDKDGPWHAGDARLTMS
eukprot:767761-Hanusia_phi.AAC.7